jgi:hypothetical protein
VASAVRAGAQGEAIATFLSLTQTGEDIGVDKGRTDRLGAGKWLAGHCRPSQPDKAGRAERSHFASCAEGDVVNLKVRKPAGKWEKVAGESYAHVVQGSEDEPPRGLGFVKVPSITLLMRQNRDAMIFGRMSGS